MMSITLSTKRLVAALALSATLMASVSAADAPATAYSNNFEKAALGKPDKDFLVYAGAFEVKEVDGNKVLELPGEPLESLGAMFGPADQALIDVRAKVWGATTGKRF